MQYPCYLHRLLCTLPLPSPSIRLSTYRHQLNPFHAVLKTACARRELNASPKLFSAAYINPAAGVPASYLSIILFFENKTFAVIQHG